MKRGRTSVKDKIAFITSTKKQIEDCAHYNCTTFETRTMRILAEASTQLEFELHKINTTRATTIQSNFKD